MYFIQFFSVEHTNSCRGFISQHTAWTQLCDFYFPAFSSDHSRASTNASCVVHVCYGIKIIQKTVVQWVVLYPHSKKVLGLNPSLIRVFLWVCMFSKCMGFLQVLWLSQVKLFLQSDHTDLSILNVCVFVCVPESGATQHGAVHTLLQ